MQISRQNNKLFLLQVKKASKKWKRTDQWKEATKVACHSKKQVLNMAITVEQEVGVICKELQDLKDCYLMEMHETLSNAKVYCSWSLMATVMEINSPF